MTDSNAILWYRAAERYREAVLAHKIPALFDRDPATRERFLRPVKRELDYANGILTQAHRAIARLPRQEWQDVLTWRFLYGLDVFDTADAMAYCERTVMYLEKQALAYLETGKEPRRRGRQAEQPPEMQESASTDSPLSTKKKGGGGVHRCSDLTFTHNEREKGGCG